MSICFFSVGAWWKTLRRNSRDHRCCNKFPKPPLEGCTSVCTSVYFLVAIDFICLSISLHTVCTLCLYISSLSLHIHIHNKIKCYKNFQLICSNACFEQVEICNVLFLSFFQKYPSPLRLQGGGKCKLHSPVLLIKNWLLLQPKLPPFLSTNERKH